MTDVIEGTAVEVERALVVSQPGQALVAQAERPAAMIAVATALADALKNIIDRQRLYTEIRGKRYPQVEAWMTIGRLDNVVAREAERPIRNDDGSYEAFVELVRLSDGMVIGRASALCGMADDEPWGGTPAKNGRPAQPPRAEYARRSMAVTRATSRAFRQQYSWIMALAGYEPTPADEMPHERGETHQPAGREPTIGTVDGGLIGVASLGKIAPVDGQLRQTPHGMSVGFVIGEGRDKVQVVAYGPLAEVLGSALPDVIGKRVQVFGSIEQDTMTIRGKAIPFQRLTLERIAAPDWTLPAPVAAPDEPVEAPSVPLFGSEDMEALDAELVS